MSLVDGNAVIRILRKSAMPLITIAALIFTVFTYYYGKQIDVEFDVISETNVLDINAPVQGLEVIFRGQDISEKELNLRLLLLRVENKGNVHLLQKDFDQDIDWGIKVSGGDIIRTRIAGTSSPYLERNLNPKIVDGNRIVFDKIIFDKGMYFLTEILILHNKNEEPLLSTTGKISGISEISVNRSWKERANTQTGFINRITTIFSAATAFVTIILILWIFRVNQLATRRSIRSEFVELMRILKENQNVEARGE